MADDVDTVVAAAPEPDADLAPVVPPTTPGGAPATGTPLDALLIPPTVTEGLADIKRRQISEQNPIYRQFEQRQEEDRSRAVRAIDATAIGPDELQPWNADAMRERYRTDPLESFGSLGSVFAIIASAFTKDPMANALNGAAAAMTAVKAGNEAEFVKAYDAWQKNTDLAVKRHNIQQQDYANAINLMSTDAAAGRAKLLMTAAKYGDQATLFLLENGLDKDVIDLQQRRNQAVLTAAQASKELTQEKVREELLKRDPNFNNADTNEYVRAAHRLGQPQRA